MTVTSKKLGQVNLNTSANVVTLATGAAGGHSEVSSIIFANTGSSTRNITVLAYGTGVNASNMIAPKITIEPSGFYILQCPNCPIPLQAGETLRAYQDAGTDVVATVCGIEEV